ncbi:ABC transporter ATP-binding protein [Marisediminicola senii]|uniref:ABC transporter ATP-binding protein n=1 Tax=Marisediminicola senii TaxID=2711233 RepID=UPI0013ECEF5D|nr:ABC transporter ATP-binding protein [Marisediminicola senii]
MTSHLLLSDVSKQFSHDQAPALDAVTLDVAAGSCTAILGPSGSGKSTILRVMAGLDPVSSGQVFVDGVDVGGLAPERRGMGMVFQRPLLFPHLSVLDNVAFADRVAGTGRAAGRRNAERYLEMVQLGGYGRRSVRELSGGQEQRVAIARALAARPRVLLLDEPFSALDPELRADMHRLIDEIRAAISPTIVLVTHDRDEASAVADHIAVLHEGELLQHDTVDAIYNRPRSLRVSRLMGGLNEVPGEVIGGAHVSAMGAVPLDDARRTPDGRATLVVRQEALAVRATDDVHPALPGVTEFAGVVAGIRHLGPRRLLTIALAGGAVELSAELPPGQAVGVGSPVGVTLPRAVVSTVPD